jgi:hypothetical protein
MTSREFAELNPRVTYASAWKLVREHNVTETEFLLAFGARDTYETEAILDWLGY